MNTEILISIYEPNKRWLVEKFVKFLCKELSIYPDSIRVAPYEIPDQVAGLCIDLTETDFLIMVKEKDRRIESIFTTIAHEMIHVKQHIKENLNDWLSSCSDTPYMERWWEIEAYKESNSLLAKFTEELKAA